MKLNDVEVVNRDFGGNEILVAIQRGLKAAGIDGAVIDAQVEFRPNVMSLRSSSGQMDYVTAGPSETVMRLTLSLRSITLAPLAPTLTPSSSVDKFRDMKFTRLIGDEK